MLNIGMCDSAYYAPGTTDADYEKMASHGFTCADFGGISRPDHPYYSMNDDELKAALLPIKEKANKAGITFSQVHGTWPAGDDWRDTDRNLEWLKRCVRATDILGDGRNLVVHPQMPYAWGEETDPAFAREENRRFFSALCEYAKDYNVNICIENMPTKRHKLAGIPAIVDFVKELNYDNFFICLDTGHCCVSGDDSGEMVRLCGNLLKVLHIHDNNGERDQHLPPYYGKINWKSFKQGLSDIGFDGCISSETSISHGIPEAIRNDLLVVYSKLMRSFDYTV